MRIITKISIITVILFFLLIVFPPDSDNWDDEISITPDIKEIPDLFPPVDRMGNGLGWIDDGIQFNNGKYTNTYYKNDCIVTYYIYRSVDPRSDVDKQSGYYTLNFASSDVGDYSKCDTSIQFDYNLQECDATFCMDDVVVSLIVINNRVSNRDISRYAHMVEKRY